MLRFCSLLLLAGLAGCATDPGPDLDVGTIEQAATAAFTRQHVRDDIWHYEATIPVGDGPNAAIRVHRIVRESAPWRPRQTPHAAMLLHGDFSSFVTNFAPALGVPASPVDGMAVFLASKNIDVWGIDRRWAIPGPDDDVSDFDQSGIAVEVDDMRIALALARATRLAGGSGGGKLALVGFSHGAQLAYTYAAVEGARPAAQRHVDALVPLDWYAAFAPAQEADRLAACAYAEEAYGYVADGFASYSNSFFTDIGALARSAPNDPSPYGAPPRTNRDVFLRLAGQTYVFGASYAPSYHLLAPSVVDGFPTGLTETSEAAGTAWFAGATAWGSTLEDADFNALLCGEGPQPVDAQLSRIRVPLFYIGAAGGIGSLGFHTTTVVSSTDVSTLVVQRFGDEGRALDFGHSDLLFANDAPALVWSPLATWIAQH